jgi:hypothetical protein
VPARDFRVTLLPRRGAPSHRNMLGSKVMDQDGPMVAPVAVRRRVYDVVG